MNLETPASTAPTCPRCRSRLDAFPTGNACAECGLELGAPAVISGTVIADIACLGCGKSLKGSTTADTCRTCGLEVARSVDGELLGQTSHAFIRRLVLGSTAVLVGMLLFGFWLGCQLLLPDSLLDPERWPGLLVGLDALFASLLGLAGWWLLSAPDPAGSLVEPSSRWRRRLRIVLPVSVATAIIASVMFPTLSGWRAELRSEAAPSFDLLRQTFGITMLLALAAWTAKTVVALKYLRSLALRLPSTSLATRAATLLRFTVLGACFFCAVVVELTLVTSLGLPQSPQRLIIVVSSIAAIVGLIVWCGAYATLIAGLRSRLHRISRVMSAP